MDFLGIDFFDEFLPKKLTPIGITSAIDLTVSEP
jgi:hypothetical protein